MSSYNLSKINELLKILPNNINLSESNYIEELKQYYKGIYYDKIVYKISFLFILKLLQEEEISHEKFNAVKITLENYNKSFDTNFKAKFNDEIIKQIKDGSDFNAISWVYGNLTDNICYPYITWRYIKIFGENSKNFEEIFQIIISNIYDKEIYCHFNFEYDKNFYFNLANLISQIILLFFSFYLFLKLSFFRTICDEIPYNYESYRFEN